jgi:hypothetical protein
MLWPTYLSGGNLEYIQESLLKTEDFREVEEMWQWTWYARRFMQEHLPFWEMEPDDPSHVNGTKELGGVQVFSKPGEVYAIYMPAAEPTGSLTMWRTRGNFVQRWYNPRTGEFDGQPRRFEGGGVVSLGSPPKNPKEDWVILIQKSD